MCRINLSGLTNKGWPCASCASLCFPLLWVHTQIVRPVKTKGGPGFLQGWPRLHRVAPASHLQGWPRLHTQVAGPNKGWPQVAQTRSPNKGWPQVEQTRGGPRSNTGRNKQGVAPGRPHRSPVPTRGGPRSVAQVGPRSHSRHVAGHHMTPVPEFRTVIVVARSQVEGRPHVGPRSDPHRSPVRGHAVPEQSWGAFEDGIAIPSESVPL